MTDNRKKASVPTDRHSLVEETNATAAERRAAIETLIAMAKKAGWRSDRPYGPRDELYNR